MTVTPTTLKYLQAAPITPENFAPFGQVIFASEDGTPYSAADAQLKLDEGIPRFYIMRLAAKGRKFHAITRHQRCTQCLGSLKGVSWFIAVAPPDHAPEPDPAAIRAFAIPGDCFIKLHGGTWHAGPLFDAPTVDFYNLELSDTNVVDHQTCSLRSRFHVEFEIV
ncbi:MAG TPA: ureidoglycolate lyase [Candidatus Obscuribacterales bacterium]